MSARNQQIKSAMTRKLSRNVRLSDVLNIIQERREHYPADVFPRESENPECKAAYMVRHTCDYLVNQLMRL